MPKLEQRAPEPITKLEAAHRQLREAIRLFFERRDALSIHTLAAAAHKILVDLGKRKGNGGALKTARYIREERFGEWIAAISKAENFLKHADHDPEETLRLDRTLTESFLLDAVDIYQFLSGASFKEGLIYKLWWASTHENLVLEGAFKDALKSAKEQFPGLNLEDFSLIRQLLDD